MGGRRRADGPSESTEPGPWSGRRSRRGERSHAALLPAFEPGQNPPHRSGCGAARRLASPLTVLNDLGLVRARRAELAKQRGIDEKPHKPPEGGRVAPTGRRAHTSPRDPSLWAARLRLDRECAVSISFPPYRRRCPYGTDGGTRHQDDGDSGRAITAMAILGALSL
jgi:hypothetical protein